MFENYSMCQDSVEKNCINNDFEGNACDSHGCYFNDCEEFPPHYDCNDKEPMFPPQCNHEIKPHNGQCGFGGSGAGFAGNGSSFVGNGSGIANNATVCSPNRGINVIPGQNRVIRKDYTINGSTNRIQNNNYYRNYYTRYNYYIVNTTNYTKSFVRDVNVYYYTSNIVYEGTQHCGCTTMNKGCHCGC